MLIHTGLLSNFHDFECQYSGALLSTGMDRSRRQVHWATYNTAAIRHQKHVTHVPVLRHMGERLCRKCTTLVDTHCAKWTFSKVSHPYPFANSWYQYARAQLKWWLPLTKGPFCSWSSFTLSPLEQRVSRRWQSSFWTYVPGMLERTSVVFWVRCIFRCQKMAHVVHIDIGVVVRFHKPIGFVVVVFIHVRPSLLCFVPNLVSRLRPMQIDLSYDQESVRYFTMSQAFRHDVARLVGGRFNVQRFHYQRFHVQWSEAKEFSVAQNHKVDREETPHANKDMQTQTQPSWHPAQQQRYFIRAHMYLHTTVLTFGSKATYVNMKFPHQWSKFGTMT